MTLFIYKLRSWNIDDAIIKIITHANREETTDNVVISFSNFSISYLPQIKKVKC